MIDWLSQAVMDHSDKIAIIYSEQYITFHDLHIRVNQICGYFNSIGLKNDDKIGVYVESSLDYIYLIHAFLRYKLIFVPINTQLTSREVQLQLSMLDIDNIVISKTTSTRLDLAELTPSIHLIENIVNYQENSSSSEQYESSDDIVLDSIICIIFTSGTTGKPKAAPLSYNNVYSSAIASQNRLGRNSDEKWLLTIPLFHIGGLSIIYRSLIYQTTIVLVDKYDEQNLPAIVIKYDVSLLSLIPIMLKRILAEFSDNPFPSSLRLILLGGASTDPGLIKLTDELKIPIAVTYGLTEASSQIATALPSQISSKPTSVGKPLDGIEIMILSENGRELETNLIGNIHVRGPNIVKSYILGDSDNFTNSGYFNTGDMGFLDDVGDLSVISRRTDLIITGGENVYPLEIENLIYSYPEVIFVCVVPFPSEKWGEEVIAIMSVSANYKESIMMKLCQDNLGDYKIPKHFIITDKLPLTSTGKIDRIACRDLVSSNFDKLLKGNN